MGNGRNSFKGDFIGGYVGLLRKGFEFCSIKGVLIARIKWTRASYKTTAPWHDVIHQRPCFQVSLTLPQPLREAAQSPFGGPKKTGLLLRNLIQVAVIQKPY